MTEFIWFGGKIFKQLFLGCIGVTKVHLNLIGQALGFGQALYEKKVQIKFPLCQAFFFARTRTLGSKSPFIRTIPLSLARST